MSNWEWFLYLFGFSRSANETDFASLARKAKQVCIIGTAHPMASVEALSRGDGYCLPPSEACETHYGIDYVVSAGRPWALPTRYHEALADNEADMSCLQEKANSFTLAGFSVMKTNPTYPWMQLTHE